MGSARTMDDEARFALMRCTGKVLKRAAHVVRRLFKQEWEGGAV